MYNCSMDICQQLILSCVCKHVNNAQCTLNTHTHTHTHTHTLTPPHPHIHTLHSTHPDMIVLLPPPAPNEQRSSPVDHPGVPEAGQDGRRCSDSGGLAERVQREEPPQVQEWGVDGGPVSPRVSGQLRLP